MPDTIGGLNKLLGNEDVKLHNLLNEDPSLKHRKNSSLFTILLQFTLSYWEKSVTTNN